jgi:hypothetical protein
MDMNKETHEDMDVEPDEDMEKEVEEDILGHENLSAVFVK